MKISFITVGRKNDPGLDEAISDFTSRIGHYAPVAWRILPPSDIEKESSSILKALDKRDYAVLLDERGKEVDSLGLASFLEKRLNDSTHQLVFIIGGAYGVNEEVRTAVRDTLSFSKLTFPHQLMRLILAEQVYRAFTILHGEKYHHQ